MHKCSSLPLSRRREPVDPTEAHRLVTPKHQPAYVSSSSARVTTSSTSIHGCDVSITVSRGCCRTTLRLGVGDAFPAIGTLLSPFVAVPAVSLELLRFGYRLLILALVTFLACAFALAVLALAFPFDFPFPSLPDECEEDPEVSTLT